MTPDQWPVKVILGCGAILIGGGDLSFSVEPVSPGVLLFVGVLLFLDAFSDREKVDSAREYAQLAKAAREKAEATAKTSEAAERLRLQRQAFKAGLRLGFMKAEHLHNEDLLSLQNTPPDLRERLAQKQRERATMTQELIQQFGHLIETDGGET